MSGLSRKPALLEEALQVLDLLLGAHKEGHPLVDLSRVYLHHPTAASGALAASLRVRFKSLSRYTD